jgi:hypothetical protein
VRRVLRTTLPVLGLLALMTGCEGSTSSSWPTTCRLPLVAPSTVVPATAVKGHGSNGGGCFVNDR